VPAIELITGVRMPVPDRESHLLVAALEERGATAAIRAWGGRPDADLVMVRTPWDYIARPEELAAWCREAAEDVPVLNPPDVIAWNTHKRYLAELPAMGVPTVRTTLLEKGADAAAELPAAAGYAPSVVVKPAIGSGARGAGRFTAGDPAAVRHLAGLLEEGDALVQPYVEEIAAAGEQSLIFFDGEFSHAVSKTAAGGDYRVQVIHGGVLADHQPGDAQLALAGRALEVVGADLLYARIDMVTTQDGPQVMELELIEPELFLPRCAEAPGRLADAILARVG
jgi:glutathione synthase/RimK-type ligase-like ATP-grasp enzyme